MEPFARSEACVPASTTEPFFIIMTLSTNRPKAHLFDVSTVAAPELRSALIKSASSTSSMCVVASSKSRIDPNRHFETESADDSGLSLHAIAWARTFAKLIFDHEAGDNKLRLECFDNSSSFAVTFVSNFDGKFDITVFDIPLMAHAKFTALLKVDPPSGCGIFGQIGCKISDRADPE